jgi:arsenite oxidase small subunit
MKGCDKLIDVGRRQFLRGGALATAGVAAATVLPHQTEARPQPARVEYPSSRLANVSQLKPNTPLAQLPQFGRG